MNTRRIAGLLSLLLFASFALAGCGGGGGGATGGTAAVNPANEPTPGPGLATIRGYVTDPATRMPVAGAVVTLSSGEGIFAAPAARGAAVRRAVSRAPITSTVTDERGYYEFAKIPTGDYGVTVSKDGKSGAFFVARATSDTFVDGTIELTPVVTLAGQVAVPKLPRGNDDFPPLVWLSGTSFGSICKPEPSLDTTTHLLYSFAISGVPVRAGASYTVAYYADDAVSRARSLSFGGIDSATFDGASVAIANFQVALGRTELSADPYESNRPPVASATAPPSVALGVPVTLDASGTVDPDGHALTFQWLQTAGYPVSLSGTGAARTFTATRAGVYTFLLMATDTFGAQSAPVAVTVEATEAAGVANRPPTATVGGDQTVTAPATVTLTGLGNDPDANTTLTYRWVQISGPAATLADPAAATTTFAANVPGTLVFAFSASDGHYTSSPAFVRVTVNGTVAANRPPTADAGADQVDAAPGTQVTLAGSASDPDNTAPTFRWTQVLGTPVALTSPDSALTRFTPQVPGIYVFAFTASDGQLSSTDYVQVFVADPANAMPVAVAGADIAVDITNGPVQVTLDGSGSNDSENDPLTYSWMQTGGPPATLSDYAAAQPTFTAGVAGVLYFSLVVADGYQLSEPSFVRVSVTGNAIGAPTVNAGVDQTVLVNETVTIAATATDPNSLPVTFRWAQVSGPGVTLADPGSGGVSKTFAPTVPGAYLFMVTADNGQAVSLPDYVEVRVNTPTNQTPVANAGADVPAAVAGAQVTLDGSGSSDDGNPATPGALSFKWTQTLGQAVNVVDGTLPAARFTPSAPGVYEFELEVFDGLARATDRMRVTVKHPPVAKISPAPAEAQIGTGIPLNGLDSFDPDGDPILSYAWSVVSQPAGATVSFGSPTLPQPTFTATHIGLYRIQLVVQDAQLGSAPAFAEIRLNAPAPVAAKVIVTQNGPGSPDAIHGLAGAVPANASILVSATDAPPFEPLGSGIAVADGSFAAFSIGDNDARIRNDAIFVAVTDAAGVPGPFARLVNDVTPPSLLELTDGGGAPIAAQPPLDAATSGIYEVHGRTEPFAIVDLVISLNPDTSRAVTVEADGAGRFTSGPWNLSSLPDAAGYTLYARAADKFPGTPNRNNTGAYRVLAAGLNKDTVPPDFFVSSPMPFEDMLPPDFPVYYGFSETLSKVVFTLTGPGTYTMTLTAPEFTTYIVPGMVAPAPGAPSRSPIPKREISLPFTPDPATPGTPGQGQYTLSATAYDLAGNLSPDDSRTIFIDVAAPAPPSPPDPAAFHVVAHAQSLFADAASLPANAGMKIGVKFANDPTPYLAVDPAPYSVASMIPLANWPAVQIDGQAVTYVWEDPSSGASSDSAPDGSVPAPLTPLQAEGPDGLRIGPGAAEYELLFTGSAMDFSGYDQTQILVRLGATPPVPAGSVFSGMFTAYSDPIPGIDLLPGVAVEYIVKDSVYAHESVPFNDGSIARLTGITIDVPGVANDFGTGDVLKFTFSAPVAHMGIGPADIAIGPVPMINFAFVWPATLGEINLAPHSTTNTQAQLNSLTAFMVQAVDATYQPVAAGMPATDHRIEFTSPAWSPGTPAGVNSIVADLHPRGTTLFQSPGGHLVLPFSQIAPSGQTGGIAVQGGL